MRGARALLLALSLAGLPLGCGGDRDRPNVLIIAVDTLRPDHLGCYGYHRPTSPSIDRLAGDGVVFENALSHAPWTLPSFASLFTSLYPTQHGATTVETSMGSDFPTLAGILAEAGYATGAIVNAPVLRSEYHLNRGFQSYDEPSGELERPADEVTRTALAWMDSVGGGPFFAFVHYFDPHLAYAPPEPYDTLYDPDYAGPLDKSFDLDYFSSKKAATIRKELKALDEADRNHIVCLYDGEIAFTDSAIGGLLDGLEERGLGEITLIVLLSDHGEEFFEHGGLDHGHSLYGELLRVPLIMRFPHSLRGGTRVAQQARLIDVMPTILDYTGIEGQFGFEGASLLPLVEETGQPEVTPNQLLRPGFCLSEAMRRTNMVKSITSYPYKLIQDLEADAQGLFNLDADPTEQTDIAEANPGQVRLLDGMMWPVVFRMSNTWFVEMGAGGLSHIFDLEIVPEREGSRVGIRLFRFVKPDGGTASVGTAADVSTGQGLLIRDLEMDDTLLLAFQVEQPGYPVTFDLSLDGTRSPTRVYLGDSLSTPESIPFAQSPRRRRVRSEGRPALRPDPPYFHIWHSKSEYAEGAKVGLSPRTRSELRSLGYIQ